jgi:hypothetical protein
VDFENRQTLIAYRTRRAEFRAVEFIRWLVGAGAWDGRRPSKTQVICSSTRMESRLGELARWNDASTSADLLRSASGMTER